jgi:MraZ protein
MESPRLIGVYEHSLDDKGRVTLPVKFRPHFAGQVLLADLKESYAPCVRVYTSAGWDEHIGPLAAGPDDLNNPELSMRRRRINSAAFEVDVDRQGRVLLPTTMIEHFGLAKSGSVRILGNGTHLEIWNPATYDRVVAPEEGV